MDEEDIERAAIMQFDGKQSAEHVEKLAEVVGKKLRPYQERGIEELREKLRAGKKRVLFYLPTGGGKTEVAAAIARAVISKEKRAAFVCHRIELVNQASARFNADGLYHGIIQGNNSRGEWNALVVCSIQTLDRREAPEVDMLIVDEAHACASAVAYHRLFEKYAGKPIIGLSATPFSKGLGKQFEDMVIAATIPELIRDGYLVDCDIYGPSEPDLTGVKMVAGDYHEGQLGEAVDKESLIGDIVLHWKKLAQQQQTICFATNIAHSKHICEQFTAAGIDAQHIDAYTDEFERKRIIKGFREGRHKIQSNVSVLAEGFDVPQASVMILARPTKSLVRYIQMAGRVLRPFPGKDRAMMLDHSGTAKRLGFPTDELPLELDDGKPNKAGVSRKPDAPLPKPCPSCHFLKPAKVHQCPKCGFKPERQSDVEVEDGNLVRMERKKSDQFDGLDRLRFFAMLRWISLERKYSEGWAAHQYKAKFGTWPNAYRGAQPMEPDENVVGWVRSRQIAWAKSRKNPANVARSAASG